MRPIPYEKLMELADKDPIIHALVHRKNKEKQMLTDEQKSFIELSKKAESLKNELKELGPKLEELLNQIGVGSSFQDPTDNTVFEIVVPRGTFVSFKTVDYDRTKREGESKGSLSVKRAKELGFNL